MENRSAVTNKLQRVSMIFDCHSDVVFDLNLKGARSVLQLNLHQGPNKPTEIGLNWIEGYNFLPRNLAHLIPLVSFVTQSTFK
jgi:hypothetical protein